MNGLISRASPKTATGWRKTERMPSLTRIFLNRAVLGSNERAAILHGFTPILSPNFVPESDFRGPLLNRLAKSIYSQVNRTLRKSSDV